MDLFLAKSYHGTSTAEICEHLGISKPTLYWHFKNKEDLLFYAHKDLVNRLLDRIIDAMKEIEDPLERLTFFINEYVRIICKYPELKLLVHESMFLDEEHYKWITDRWSGVLSSLKTIFQELKKQGRMRNLKDSFTALSLFGMCTWPYYWFDYTRPEGVEGLIENIQDIFLRGILTKCSAL
jgi:AcrR family transcriptional regulator